MLQFAHAHGAEFRALIGLEKELGHFPMSENRAQFRRYNLPVLHEVRRKLA